MEWKKGNIATTREMYQKALSIGSTIESVSRCLQVNNKCNLYKKKYAY